MLRELWKELTTTLTDDRDFAVSPFEGGLEDLLASRQIVLAETYPGLAYAAALAEALPTHRIFVSKTKREARDQACELLEGASWVREADVELGDLAPARADEDAFDSHLTAAAILRCVIQDLPFCHPNWIDREAEGGMLLAGPVDPAHRGRRFRPAASRTSANPEPGVAPERPDHPCPLPGCAKVLLGGRGGWDAHVGSHRLHPQWHPEVHDPEERKRLFKEEYASWFR